MNISKFDKIAQQITTNYLLASFEMFVNEKLPFQSLQIHKPRLYRLQLEVELENTAITIPRIRTMV
jgi:hypothetical protein